MELWTAFLLGLAGSLHCAGMCGPLVLALAKARPRTARELAGRVCHHLGRVASYCLLGLMLGLFGRLAAPDGWQRWLSIALGVALLVASLAASRIPLGAPLMKWITLLKGSMPGLLQRRTLISQTITGVLHGLLPCSLVYVAAVGATATGHAFTGAAYMALFGLGTWPMMLGIHLAGHRLSLPVRLPPGRVARAAVWMMAVLLILRGLELGIPYVSPDLSAHAGEIRRCH